MFTDMTSSNHFYVLRQKYCLNNNVFSSVLWLYSSFWWCWLYVVMFYNYCDKKSRQNENEHTSVMPKIYMYKYTFLLSQRFEHWTHSPSAYLQFCEMLIIKYRVLVSTETAAEHDVTPDRGHILIVSCTLAPVFAPRQTDNSCGHLSHVSC